MEMETTPYRCKRCRARYHLADLVERTVGAQTSLLCQRCAGFHDAWAQRSAYLADLLQRCASGTERPRPYPPRATRGPRASVAEPVISHHARQGDLSPPSTGGVPSEEERR